MKKIQIPKFQTNLLNNDQKIEEGEIYLDNKNKINSKKSRLRKTVYTQNIKEDISNLKKALYQKILYNNNSLIQILKKTLPHSLMNYNTFIFPENLDLSSNDKIKSFIMYLNKIISLLTYTKVEETNTVSSSNILYPNILLIYTKKLKKLLDNYIFLIKLKNNIYV